jgi:hypothetical protein
LAILFQLAGAAPALGGVLVADAGVPGHARQPKLSDDFREFWQDVIRRNRHVHHPARVYHAADLNEAGSVRQIDIHDRGVVRVAVHEHTHAV